MSFTSLSDYDYYLPEELIAQDPLEKRDNSRLLVLSKDTGRIFHDRFFNIGKYLNPDDTLVINDTKVIPARLYGTRSTGARIEVLLLKRIDDERWEVLTRPGKRTRIGSEMVFSDRLRAVIEDEKEDGIRVVRFIYEGIFEEILDETGIMPLPPYIKHELKERSRYQTVYARLDGSAAAPTAGLHFTKELLADLQKDGVNIANVTLHVGLGTFRPVSTDNILEHKMHSECYKIDKKSAELINVTKMKGGRIVAVGTTSVRTLESVAAVNGGIVPSEGETDIFIYPGFDFRVTDAVVTNFHLPKSTLLMLVSAFAGRENVLNAYREAVENEYRFFSFGDSMLII